MDLSKHIQLGRFIAGLLIGLVIASLARGVVAQEPEEPASPASDEGDEADEADEADELLDNWPDDDWWEDEEDADVITAPPVTIVTTPEELAVTGGSVHVLDEEALDTFDYSDPHDVLLQVPGVYVRHEDAFGLRPNIGLRGANSERSRRVALMEDGILFGPAPYSAPAAYYFPIMSRMVQVEVFKGPASLRYGPNTIGGAINLVSRSVPVEPEGGLDASFGQYLTGRLHLHYGASNEHWGYLVEGVHLHSNGFKELESDDFTGFDRSEVILTGRYNSDLTREVFHQLELRLGVSREISHETYLGLTDADFEADPYRRYPASQLARMSWWRTQGRLTYRLEQGESRDLTATLYRHDFDRAWRKLNRFADGPSLESILANPTGGVESVFYDVLTGEADSTSLAETLQIGTNARRYVSEGVQLVGHQRGEVGEIGLWEVELGLRLHHDTIERDHTEVGHLMQDGQLVPDGTGQTVTTDNSATALALAAWLLGDVTLGPVTLRPGLRLESIWTELEDHLADTSLAGDQLIVLPGLGIHYALTDSFGLLAGVHRGFSPVAPGQPPETDPETSISYELGGRFFDLESGSQAEVIGFLSDYGNLIGQCSFSAGCDPDDLDRQFNAGEVRVWGIEVLARHEIPVGTEYVVPLRLTYTWTDSRFLSSFESENPQFGEVDEGDELPYVPEHQATLGAGIEGERWGLNLSATFVDEMREEAGQGDEGSLTDRYVMLDATAHYALFEGAEIYVRGDNLTATTPIAARRPFGARPAKPLLILGGFRWHF